MGAASEFLHGPSEVRPLAVREPDADPAVLGWFRALPLKEESYHAARHQVLALFELEYLRWLLRRSGGNLSKAARVAGMDRTWLYRLLERNGLTRSTSIAPEKVDTRVHEFVPRSAAGVRRSSASGLAIP